MKTFKNLYPKISSFATLETAFHKELSYEQLDRSVQAWIAHAAHGDTWGLRRALLRPPIPASP